MGILDRFKKATPEPKKEEAKKPSVKVAAKKSAVKDEPVAEVKSQKPTKGEVSGIAYKVLAGPHITERAAVAEMAGKYIFKVYPNANKNEIKKAVKDLYGVSVQKVNVINMPKKPRRVGRSQGYKTGFRKAIVTLVEGEKIEIISR